MSVLVLGLLSGVAYAGSPAMVTTIRGEVDLVSGEASADAPAPPFLLEDGQSLSLAQGALVVVLFEGNATQLTGPATLSHASLKRSQTATREGVDVLGELLTRHVSTAPTGASRTVGDLQLVRPVPGSSVLAPHTIAWRCDGCGPQQVQVYDILDGDVEWESEGTGAVQYAGPALDAGAYSVMLAGRDYAFTVVEGKQRARAEAAIEVARQAAAGLEAADPAVHASVIASVYLQAGLPSEALYTIDAAIEQHPGDPALEELKVVFEAKAGLAP